MSMFAIRQKLLLSGSVLVAVLLVAGGYYGSRWLFSPDVDVVTEYALPDGPLPTKVNRPMRASGAQHTASETDLVSPSGNESSSDSELLTDADSTSIDGDLEAQLAALSDDEFAELAEALEQDEGESSKYPPVPDGYPSDLKPVWLEDYFHDRDFSAHVILDRALIKLWNRGDHDFVNGVLDEDTGRVYPIYPDMIYVKWDSYVRENPDGESIEVPYISARLADSRTMDPLLNSDEKLFTEEEILSGAYKTKFPGIRLVEYDSAGYDLASVLGDNY